MRWSIITPDGHVLAGRYDISGGVIAADIDLARRRLINEKGETVDLRGYLFQSRRPELYELISQKYEVSPDGFYGTESYETICDKTFTTMREVYEALTQPVKMASETIPPAPGKARAAVVCLEEKSLEKGIAAIDEAARRKPDLICLPQDFAGTDPEPIPGPTTEKIFRKAKQYGTYIIAPQRETNRVGTYASAVMCDREGKLLGVYRETHLTREQKAEGLKPGESISTFDTDFGRIGVMLGFDFFFPEVSRILTLKGARALFWPTTGMPEWPGQQTLQTMLMGRAFAYKTYMAMASFGEKPEAPHVPFKIRRKGCIIDLEGQPIADTSFGPGIAEAMIDLSSDFYCSVGAIPSASYRHVLLRERRPELYAPITEGTLNFH